MINKLNTPRTIVSESTSRVSENSVEINEVNGKQRTVGSISGNGQASSQNDSVIVNNIEENVHSRTSVQNGERAGAVINNASEVRTVQNESNSDKLFNGNAQGQIQNNTNTNEVSSENGSGRQFDNK